MQVINTRTTLVQRAANWPYLEALVLTGLVAIVLLGVAVASPSRPVVAQDALTLTEVERLPSESQIHQLQLEDGTPCWVVLSPKPMMRCDYSEQAEGKSTL